MDDLLYNRQEKLDLNIPEKVCVIGVGGIGSWIAIFSALSGVKRIKLFDDDILEIHNLNRLPYKQEDVGVDKTIVAEKFLQGIRPNLFVEKYSRLEEESLLLLDGTVFDCTDSFKTQEMIYKHCKDKGLPYFRTGYDGKHITVTTSLDDVWEGEKKPDQGGYTVVPSYAPSPAIAGALAVAGALEVGVTKMDVAGQILKLNEVDDDEEEK